MGIILEYSEGQTPLDEDEKEGLLIASVTTRIELDEAEQRNIEEAIKWTVQRRKKFTTEEILTEKFVSELHTKMFGNVWKWAGSFRNTNKNIGVDKYQIGTDLKILLDDCKFWVVNKTYSPNEIALRVKHRIVSIHCFANGNGRHSRLFGDIIIEKIFKESIFSWGAKTIIHKPEYRHLYLKALREADKGNYSPLIKFANS